MKKKLYGIIAIVAIIVLAFTACGDGNGNSAPYSSIGSTGPGGGKVFYDKGNDSGGWRYLEAVIIEDQFKWKEGDFPENLPNTGKAIGTGSYNTALLIDELGEDEYAAYACASYPGGGKDDWFLPSKDELNEIHKQRELFNIDGYGWFWSSSFASFADGETYAWVQLFDNDNKDNGDAIYYKAYSYHYVFAVRAF